MSILSVTEIDIIDLKACLESTLKYLSIDI